MIRLIKITLIFLFFSCTRSKPKQVYSLPDFKDINEIIETIVWKDSLPVLLDNRPPDTVFSKGLPDYIIYHGNKPISIDLRKMRIFVPEVEISPEGLSILYDNYSIPIHDLLNRKVNGKFIFSVEDSLYFLFQNDTLNQFRINELFAKKLMITNLEEQTNRRNANEYIFYYDLTIPVFSLDNKKAYVQVTYNCSGLCGGATAIFLEKINGEWSIISKYNIWIS